MKRRKEPDVTVDSSSIFKRKKTPGGIKYAKSPYMYQAKRQGGGGERPTTYSSLSMGEQLLRVTGNIPRGRLIVACHP